MTATINSVEVKGFTGNGKVKRALHDASKEEANQRFTNLKPNRLLITGTNLNEVGICDPMITFSVGGYTFVIIESVVVEGSANTQLNLYFVVWKERTLTGKAVLDLGDLTVTVETTSVTEVDVTIED